METDRRIARLWVWYRRRRAVVIRNALVEHYVPLVRDEAIRAKARLPRSVEVDELISFGHMGLMRAVERYNPMHSAFSTYAPRRIQGAILDGLRQNDWAPRTLRNKAREHAQATAQLRSEQGRAPTPDEIARRLKLKPAVYRQYEQATRAAAPLSLSPGRLRDGAVPGAPADSIPAPVGCDPAREAQRKALKELLSQHLNREDRLLLLLYYCEDLRMHEIGAVLGIGESRVSQKHKEILAQLRAVLRPEQLGAAQQAGT